MPRVRNRVTGLVHEVPAGHPALSDDRHEVLPESESDRPTLPDSEPPEIPKPVQRKRSRK